MDAFLSLNGAGTTGSDTSLAWTILIFVAVLALVYCIRLFVKSLQRSQLEMDRVIAESTNRQKLAQELATLKITFEAESAGLSNSQKKMLWNPVEKALKYSPSTTSKADKWAAATERARQAIEQVRKLNSMRK